jgi:hypothetical protein
VGRATLVSLLVAAVLGTSAGQAGSGTGSHERVTFIGDSIASVISYDAPSKKVLAKGIDLDLQLAVCRRLVGESCPYQGVRPLSLVDLLPTIELGSTVVVEVGYNDFEDPFADSVEASLQALKKAGAVRVLWLTLRADRTSYLSMNDVIRAAATRHPEMTVVDWNLFSRSHPDWFQDDGLHLDDVGALMMATLVHRSLDQLGVVAAAPAAKLAITTKALPAARVGRAYKARLIASGGERPIVWTVKAGMLPAGLRLTRDGWVRGTPKSAGKHAATLRATDSSRRTASRRFVLAVRAR